MDTGKPAGDGTYLLVMLPYPSGDRLHVGHARTYFLTDALHRFLRQTGVTVFCPMGWDAFGLPAENYAIQKGIHPRTSTLANIAAMKEQFRAWGVLYDWTKEVTTCEPEYYRWNQWFFLRLLEKGLAVRKKSAVNWCPSCLTVLANEQAEGGVCERCRTPVVQRELEQWFLKITDYAERLLDGLDTLGTWPEKVVTMQRNWIGKSTGADLDFAIPSLGETVRVFTTRPDTVFGATALILAPEHALVPRLLEGHPKKAELEAWVASVRSQERIVREAEGAEKDGRDTGRKAINPFTGQEVPVWLANFVIADYGTGALMAVPAHDTRDFDFAKKYGIPIVKVIEGREEKEDLLRREEEEKAGGVCPRTGEEGPPSAVGDAAYTGEGRLIASGTILRKIFFRRPRTDRRRSRSPRDRRAARALPAARLAHFAPALLGHADPDDPLREGRLGAGAGEGPAGRPAAGRAVHGQGRQSAREGRLVREHDVPPVLRPRAPRDGHDGHVRGLVLVLPEVHRPEERRRARSTPPSRRSGRPSTSTSAASSTRSSTSCTRGSSRAS